MTPTIIHRRWDTGLAVMIVVAVFALVVSLSIWSTRSRCERLMTLADTHSDSLIVYATVMDRTLTCEEILR